jgi:hypothetical protein
MALKRRFWEGGEDGSEFPGGDFKRRPAFAFARSVAVLFVSDECSFSFGCSHDFFSLLMLFSILRNVNRTPHELGPFLEPLIRTWVCLSPLLSRVV